MYKTAYNNIIKNKEILNKRLKSIIEAEKHIKLKTITNTPDIVLKQKEDKRIQEIIKRLKKGLK